MSLGGGLIKWLPRGDLVLACHNTLDLLFLHGRHNGLVCVSVSKTPLPLVPAADS